MKTARQIAYKHESGFPEGFNGPVYSLETVEVIAQEYADQFKRKHVDWDRVARITLILATVCTMVFVAYFYGSDTGYEKAQKDMGIKFYEPIL